MRKKRLGNQQKVRYILNMKVSKVLCCCACDVMVKLKYTIIINLQYYSKQATKMKNMNIFRINCRYFLSTLI